MSDESATLDLGSSIKINNATEFCEKAREAVSANKQLSLIGKKIEIIDTAGLQLLISLIKLNQKDDYQITWESVSDSLREKAELLGVSEQLQLPSK